MQFESLNIYHIYNQGNNRQPIFFCRENYLFFLKKMKERLMPNHFHWMVHVREEYGLEGGRLGIFVG